MAPIVLITGRYQLGNDPGIFQDALYVGFELTLPFTKTWIDPTAKDITFAFYTHDVETWGQWKGHRVAINNVEIGRIKDPDDIQGASEISRLVVPRATIDLALAGKDTFLLSVELDVQPSSPGLSDDFVLWRIETDGNNNEGGNAADFHASFQSGTAKVMRLAPTVRWRRAVRRDAAAEWRDRAGARATALGRGRTRLLHSP